MNKTQAAMKLGIAYGAGTTLLILLVAKLAYGGEVASTTGAYAALFLVLWNLIDVFFAERKGK